MRCSDSSPKATKALLQGPRIDGPYRPPNRTWLIAFDGAEHQVAVLSGSWVQLVSPDGTPRAVLLTHLVGSPGFDILGGDPAEPRRVLADHALSDVAEEVAQRARQWEQHITRSRPGFLPAPSRDSAAK